MERHRALPHVKRYVLSPVWVVIVVALAVLVSARYGLVSWLDRMNPHEPFPYAGDHLGDYKDAVWLPGRDLLAGRDPYDSVAFARAHPSTQGYSPYTPSHLLVAAVFAPLSWSFGSAVWTVLSTVSIATMGLVTAGRAVGLAGVGASTQVRLAVGGLGVLGAWLWRPDAMSIGLGQPTAIYGSVAAVVGVAVLGRRSAGADRVGRVDFADRASGDLAVGLWTALALSKPQVGLQSVLALMIARRWRALVVAVASTAVASLVVAAWLANGPQHLASWLINLPGHVTSAPSRFAAAGDNPWVDVSATVYRAGLRQGVATAIGPLAALAALAGAVFAATRLRRAGRPWLAAVAITLGGLAAIPHAVYDALLLFPVVVLAAVEAWRVWRPAAASPAAASPGGVDQPFAANDRSRRGARWGVATVILSIAIGAVPNRIPFVALEPGAAVGALLLMALACAITASCLTGADRPAPARPGSEREP